MNGRMKRTLAILMSMALAAIWPAGLAESAGYAFDPEEIMYLAGVEAAAKDPNARYSLCDVDGDGISELFVDEDGEVKTYRYDAASNAPVRSDMDFDAATLNWVGSDQWVDSSIVGVAARVGDPGPENDFYLSSNYDWLSAEQVKSQGEIVTGLDGLEAEVAANKASLLEDRQRYSGEDVERVWDYYDAATNWEKRDAEGVEPARRYVEAALAPTTLDELTAFIADPDADPFCRMLGITVSLDEQDTSHWAAVLEEDAFSVLPRIYHNGEPEDIEASRWDFDVRARHVLGRLGYDEGTVDDILAGCYQVEDRLLAVAWPDESGEPNPLDGFVPYETVAKACERFPLEAVLNACGIHAGMVNVYYPKYLGELDALYIEENLDILKAYLAAHIAADACEMLDYEAAICMDEANGDARTREDMNDSYRVETLSSRGPVSVALLNAYMTAFVDPATREDLIALCEEIRGAFRVILEGEDWLSEAGREAAIRKLDNMAFSVMAPDTLIDSAYQAVDPDASFLDNCARLRVNALRHNAAFVGAERVKGDWRYDLRPEIATTDVNAFYYGCFNQFFILSGFVSEDVYRLDMSREEKLALLGEIIGHELTHGFDPLGIQYDENGNRTGGDDAPCGWLPEADYEAFMERANRISEYFSAIWPFPYAACPGELQWGEAAADIGGLTIGLAIARQTPDFDYDLYFRTHARLWRKQDTLVSERSDLYNEHPLSHLRINVTVQQFDEFLETYGVGEGDGMYLAPEDRICIW